MGVYNEVGELVKLVLLSKSSDPVNNIELRDSNVISRLHGNGSQVDIYYAGTPIGSWDGTNAAGDPAPNGVYHLKVDSVSTLGTVLSVTQQVMVSRALSRVEVNIFNGVGEVVRHLYAAVDDPLASTMTGISLSSSVVRPGSLSAGSPSSVQIVVSTSSQPLTLAWDGRSDSGAYVTNGHYELEAHWNDAKGGTADVSKGLLVSGARETGTVLASPNRLDPVNGYQTLFTADVPGGVVLNAALYTLAGERVATASWVASLNGALWDASGFASGMYIAVVEVLNAKGGLLQRQMIKVSVLR